MSSSLNILYGAGSHSGANIALSRFLKYYPGNVFVIAHSSNHQHLKTINVNADSLWTSSNKEAAKIEQSFGLRFKARFDNFVIANRLLEKFKPDLLICDYEYYSYKLAKIHGLPIISCSPLNLFKGVRWEFKKNITFDKLFRKFAEFEKDAISKWIYSPFGIVAGRPLLKEGYEWVNPYYEEPMLDDATTSAIADKLFANKEVLVTSVIKDKEQMLNSFWLEKLGLGLVIGATDRLSYVRRKMDSFSVHSKLDYQPWGYLHEKL
jgi:hypothetical protein